MIVRDQVYTIEDVWQLSQQPENDAERYYLIDGELFITMSPGELHGTLASEIARLLGNFVFEHGLGRVTVESGYHPSNSQETLLRPDVAFRKRARISGPARSGFVPVMPDLAVEIRSPSNTMPELRRKALVYLQHGTALVWLVNPDEKTVEIWRRSAADETVTTRIGSDGVLAGEPVLPGFTLDLGRLFSRV